MNKDSGVCSSRNKEAPLDKKIDKVSEPQKDVKLELVTVPSIIVDSSSTGTTSKYFRKRFLGKGGFAKCYAVSVEKSQNEVYACKAIDKMKLMGHTELHFLHREITIHQLLKHSTLVEYHTRFEDDEFVYIVMELCEKGSLQDLLKKRKTITEPEAKFFLRQVCEGVKYLHEMNIIHRDIKPGNIFIAANMNVKLGDFGLAQQLEKGSISDRRVLGSPDYMAPEIIYRKDYGLQVDLWALGCTLYHLMVGLPPFHSTESVAKIYGNIVKGRFTLPESLSVEAKALCLHLLNNDPLRRPSAAQIQNSMFFTTGYIPDHLSTTVLKMEPRFQPHRNSKRKLNV